MTVRVITAPTLLPVSVEQVKRHMRIDGTAEDDSYISSLIRAVTSYLDGPQGILGRALMTQTLELQTDCWCSNNIELPLPPLQSVTSVKYLSGSDTELTLDTDQYVVVDQGWAPAIIRRAYGVTWPVLTCRQNDAVRIEYVAGYETAAEIPEGILQYMLLTITDMYFSRQSFSAEAVNTNGMAEKLLMQSKMPIIA